MSSLPMSGLPNRDWEQELASQWLRRHEIEAIFFDLDNTLIDRQKAFSDFAHYFVQRHSINDSELIDEMIAFDDFGYRNREDWAVWLSDRASQHGGPASSSRLHPSAILSDFFDWLPKRFRPDSSVNQVIALIGDLLPIAIVTNGKSNTQREKIKHAGLDTIFERVVISGEVNSWKPDKVIFELAAKSVDIPFQHILMIGDDPFRDIVPAKELGMKTVWIAMARAWEKIIARPDFFIDTIQDIVQLMSSRYEWGLDHMTGRAWNAELGKLPNPEKVSTEVLAARFHLIDLDWFSDMATKVVQSPVGFDIIPEELKLIQGLLVHGSQEDDRRDDERDDDLTEHLIYADWLQERSLALEAYAQRLAASGMHWSTISNSTSGIMHHDKCLGLIMRDKGGYRCWRNVNLSEQEYVGKLESLEDAVQAIYARLILWLAIN